MIPLSQPSLTPSDLNEIKACFNSSWISSKSKWVNKFENIFSKKVSSTNYAVTVNSGTSALFLALKSLNIGPGDEVIIPTFTMIATINAVVWTGATPILADSLSKDDWNIDSGNIENKITPRTKAIIPVHIYGYPCDMDKIVAVAKKNNLYIIEDAAEAMGSLYHNKRVGCFGDISCFSLYSNKIITTGNGGIIATNSKTTYRKLQKLRFFDFDAKSHFIHRTIGYNLALSGLSAALGYSQTKRFAALVKNKRQIYKWYVKYLSHPHIRFLQPLVQANPNYWFPAIILPSPSQVKKIRMCMEEKKIESRVFFRPIHKQPVFENMFKNHSFPNAEYFWKHGLLLPSFDSLGEVDVRQIASVISSALG